LLVWTDKHTPTQMYPKVSVKGIYLLHYSTIRRTISLSLMDMDNTLTAFYFSSYICEGVTIISEIPLLHIKVIQRNFFLIHTTQSCSSNIMSDVNVQTGCPSYGVTLSLFIPSNSYYM